MTWIEEHFSKEYPEIKSMLKEPEVDDEEDEIKAFLSHLLKRGLE
nr:MAG TPA: hypothetical protein [Bacteriophage sp.]